MRNDIVTALGSVGAMINLIMLIPQGIATWRNRRDDIALSGLSWISYSLICTQGVVWLAYAFLIRDVWVGLPTLVNIPISASTAYVVRRAHRRVGRHACALCLDDVPHKVAIREVGVIRLVLCDADSRAHGFAVLD